MKSKIQNPKSTPVYRAAAAWKNKNSQNGVTLLLAILILSAILAISFSVATITLVEVSSSGDLLRTEGALYAATGVGEQALFNLKRSACPTNSPSCYTSEFNNNVSTSSSPSLVTNAQPIFTDKVTPGTNIINTPNKYDFCNVTAGAGPCNFGKVTVNYITTNEGDDPLYVYLCQWDPNAPLGSNPAPCSDTGTNEPYWIAPSSGTIQQGNSQNAPGSAALSQTVNTVSWYATNFNPSLQQELIVINPSGANNIYFSVATFASDGVTPKGLPYVGKTAIDISTANGDVGRTIQVVAPNSLESSGSATTVPVALINSGGTAYTDSLGRLWSADMDYSGGTTYSVANSISNTSDSTLYQTERYGNFTYTIGGMSPNSSHTVILKFAELFWTGPNERLFNVYINSTQVLSNFDIFQAAGGQYIAIDKTFTTTADGSGNITIQFQNGSADNAKIDAIEID